MPRAAAWNPGRSSSLRNSPFAQSVTRTRTVTRLPLGFPKAARVAWPRRPRRSSRVFHPYEVRCRFPSAQSPKTELAHLASLTLPTTGTATSSSSACPCRLRRSCSRHGAAALRSAGQRQRRHVALPWATFLAPVRACVYVCACARACVCVCLCESVCVCVSV